MFYISSLTGQSSFNFLTKSYNAESLASGNSIWVSSLQSSQEMIASELVNSETLNISYSSQTWIEDVKSRNIYLSTRMSGLGLGFYYKYYGIDGFEARTSPSIEPTSKFSNYNVAIGFSAAYQTIYDINVGVTYKYLTEKNNDFLATGNAIDLSASYHFDNYVIYSSLINVTSSMDVLKNTKTKLPELNIFGLKTVLFSISMGIEYHKKTDNNDIYNIFAYKKLNDFFYLFNGYELNSKSKSWSGGIRFQWESIILSYGYSLHKDLNNISNFQFGITL